MNCQVPEGSGAVRSAVWGPLVNGEKSVFVGTTKNCILQACFDEKLEYMTKVRRIYDLSHKCF